jgi:hypothetical protein
MFYLRDFFVSEAKKKKKTDRQFVTFYLSSFLFALKLEDLVGQHLSRYFISQTRFIQLKIPIVEIV